MLSMAIGNLMLIGVFSAHNHPRGFVNVWSSPASFAACGTKRLRTSL